MITSDQGDRKQVLTVRPDLSGLYGPTAVEKINLDGDKVNFKVSTKFGERTIELSFEGKLAENKLTGELTSPQGTRKVTGQKRGRAGADETAPPKKEDASEK
jgi:hypothetical protein